VPYGRPLDRVVRASFDRDVRGAFVHEPASSHKDIAGSLIMTYAPWPANGASVHISFFAVYILQCFLSHIPARLDEKSM
jgi:hypothetical protein